MLSIQTAFAECPKNVAPIKKGDSAVCDGYLFSPEAESEAYKAKELAELRKAENEILSQRLELYMKQSDVLAKDVARRDNTESLYRVLYFALGAVLTGYIASNVSK